uniref:Uncharacterized protein n=1 Tax=Phlebotomus papatasi TaxID=29031 RepID=A0A1B0D0H0_PHLPP
MRNRDHGKNGLIKNVRILFWIEMKPESRCYNEEHEATLPVTPKKDYTTEEESIHEETTGRNGGVAKGNIEKRNGYHDPADMCRDPSGNRILVNSTEVLNQWARYFEDLLNEDTEETGNEIFVIDTEDDNIVDPPSLEDVIDSVKRLKNNNASGLDGIPNEFQGRWAESMGSNT